MSEHCTITEVDDIGETVDFDYDNESANLALTIEGCIMAILAIEEYTTCANCESKLTTTPHDGIVDCGKCGAKMMPSKCNRSSLVRAMIQPTTGTRCRVVMFQDTIKLMVGGVEGSSISEILCSPPCTFTVKDDVVIFVKQKKTASQCDFEVVFVYCLH